MCFLLNQEQCNRTIEQVDEKLMLMGRDYLEGGVEFFSKEMRRGELLRKGLGQLGEDNFTETGELRRLFYEPEVTDTPKALLSQRMKPYKQLLC